MSADHLVHEVQSLADGTLVRPVRPEDDPALARIIRSVMSEFGAVGDGFSVNDPEVDHMSKAYAAPRSAYFVVDSGGQVLGGAGVAPLEGADEGFCELRKMYLLREGRGKGYGRVLLERCLAVATRFRFRLCYLETLATMHAAQELYEAHGFRPVDAPLGATGHFGCDRWYTRALMPPVSASDGEREIEL